MTDDIAISLSRVSKCFKRYPRPVDRLKEILLPGKSRAEEFWALQEMSLDIPKGDTFGIIGRNGSGKSTLLQIIAGTLQPTTGEVKTKGRISALLELGSGFNPEFTGRQNVFFNGRILGMSQVEIEERLAAIEAFAEIGEFIDQPVKTYSSGMFVRLAFAVAINVNPEILIVDEALAVGDIFFQAKCLKRLKQLQDIGTTILFVSHDLTSVHALCREAILLNHGQLILRDTPKQVGNFYHKMARLEYELTADSAQPQGSENLGQESELVALLAEPNADRGATLEGDRPSPKNSQDLSQVGVVDLRNTHRVSNGQATIRQVRVTDGAGQPALAFSVGDWMQVSMVMDFHEDCQHVNAGVGLQDRYGRVMAGKHTYYGDAPGPIDHIAQGERIEFVFRIHLTLQPGEYLIIMGATANQREVEADYDSLDVMYDAFAINILGISGKYGHWGLAKVDGEIQVKREAKCNG
ncbi:ABC transporter ATP-binding protein [Alkalinema pantanalense CENA528]|uniref:ABC transporter ATP-binding protein n=1 Tax=Alkalinema pantanalense TaxID=1620705 RepID=UPI003D6E75E7